MLDNFPLVKSYRHVRFPRVHVAVGKLAKIDTAHKQLKMLNSCKRKKIKCSGVKLKK